MEHLLRKAASSEQSQPRGVTCAKASMVRVARLPEPFRAHIIPSNAPDARGTGFNVFCWFPFPLPSGMGIFKLLLDIEVWFFFQFYGRLTAMSMS